MRVLIAGELPLAGDLLALCNQAEYEASLFLVESLGDSGTVERMRSEAAKVDVALECHNELKQTKRRVIELLAEAPALYVSALACSATEAASWIGQPERVVGWGALPPLEAGGAIEVAAAMQTDPARLEAAKDFWKALGLQCFRVADGAGLVRARIVCALVNEAATALADGVASAADIDTAMRLGTNYPRGPLAWGDLIGLDVVLGVMRGLQEAFGEERYRPCPLLARYVMAGRLGKKTGGGFFDYP